VDEVERWTHQLHGQLNRAPEVDDHQITASLRGRNGIRVGDAVTTAKLVLIDVGQGVPRVSIELGEQAPAALVIHADAGLKILDIVGPNATVVPLLRLELNPAQSVDFTPCDVTTFELAQGNPRFQTTTLQPSTVIVENANLGVPPGWRTIPRVRLDGDCIISANELRTEEATIVHGSVITLAAQLRTVTVFVDRGTEGLRGSFTLRGNSSAFIEQLRDIDVFLDGPSVYVGTRPIEPPTISDVSVSGKGALVVVGIVERLTLKEESGQAGTLTLQLSERAQAREVEGRATLHANPNSLSSGVPNGGSSSLVWQVLATPSSRTSTSTPSH
jgi:hypothetical protein